MHRRTHLSAVPRSLAACAGVLALVSTLLAPVAGSNPADSQSPGQVRFEEPSSVAARPLPAKQPAAPNRDLVLSDTQQALTSRVIVPARSQGTARPGLLHWQSGDAQLKPGLDPELMALEAQADNSDLSRSPFAYLVVQYAWEPTPEQASDLLAWGYRELAYIPESAFIARVPVDRLRALVALPFVHAMAPLQPEQKLALSLRDRLAAGGEPSLAVTIVAFEPLNPPTPGSLRRQGDSLEYRGNLTPEEIRAHLTDPLVQWIEPAVEARLSLATSVNVIAADNVHKLGGLDGTGVKVGVLDSGIDPWHTHFSSVDMVLAYDFVDRDNVPTDCYGHGTFVAGTIAGSSTWQNQTLTGVAPGATLIVSRMTDCDGRLTIGSYRDLFDEVSDRGARIINNSWGVPGDGSYSAGASNVDAWAREHENVLLVFANGNYPDAEYVDAPGLAKNVIAVGASVDGSPADGSPPAADSAFKVDQVSILNNLGGTADGRVKPDLNAPGTRITAPWLANEYLTARGSSAAVPHVSGVLALHLQEYPDRRTDQIKAGLINSSVDLNRKADQTAYPQGWGRATAYDFIYETGGESLDGYFRGEVGDLAPHAMQQGLTFPVPSGAKYFKVTMTYLDRPAAMNAAPALVNDIDLRLRSPSGTDSTYAGRRRDNVEQVMVVNPEPGTWTIYIDVYAIPGITETSQKFGGNVSVVTGTPSLTAHIPGTVTGSTAASFDLDIQLTADGWFAYGVYSSVEVLNSSIRLANASPSAAVLGDMYSETQIWRPTFVASHCGFFPDAIRVTVGATNFVPSSRLVDVDIPCISHTISGLVRTDSGTGISGVTMQGLPGTPATNSTGAYSASVPDGWSGTVVPLKTGYTFSPASRTYSSVTSEQPGHNYTASPFAQRGYLPLVVR